MLAIRAAYDGLPILQKGMLNTIKFLILSANILFDCKRAELVCNALAYPYRDFVSTGN